MNTSRLTYWILPILLAFSATQAWAYGTNIPASNSEAIAHTGKVIETMSSAGYTYIRVEEKGKTFWIALPEFQVSVGETISFYEQMLMENFTSKTLNRTFDRILFVEGISKGTELPAKAEVKPSPNKEAPKQVGESQKLKELGSPVGRFSVEELFQKKDELNGKVVEVKGNISKLSRQIMGTDWAHIEDGTGKKEDLNNKIIFRSTQGGVAVGDEVVAKGVLYLNKDYGSGYFYPVIVENAVFNK
ncbi:hypothetical protein [Solemya velum gill symbiont]|uniref:hypothetical protein n=1 Tax=Solemya velum gill symbiont TaxID=2340 RepID=UPI000996CD91|nr:hypothetical protein [Solemya velum gill symbiont]